MTNGRLQVSIEGALSREAALQQDSAFMNGSGFLMAQLGVFETGARPETSVILDDFVVRLAK